MLIKDRILEDSVFSLVKNLGIEVFIDVGSNRPRNADRFFSLFGSVDERVTYYGFEANPFCFAYWIDSYSKPNIIFCNLAISEYSGIQKFGMPNRNSTRPVSHLRKGLDLIDHFLFRNYHKELQRFHIANDLGGSLVRNEESPLKFYAPSLRLDEVFETFQRPTILWIDVEGVVEQVLRSAGVLLEEKNLKVVYLEFDTTKISAEDRHYIRVNSLLESFGFVCISISELGNGLYLRKECVGVFKAISVAATTINSQKRKTKFLRVKSLVTSIERDLKSFTD